jgi:hypothetical protein
LKARRAELDELRAELKKAGDMAAAAPVRKELSERRSRYRRSLASLVELVQSAEDAGGEIAIARTATIDLLTQDAKSMQGRLDSLSLEAIEDLETISKGTRSPSIFETDSKLVPTASRASLGRRRRTSIPSSTNPGRIRTQTPRRSSSPSETTATCSPRASVSPFG